MVGGDAVTQQGQHPKTTEVRNRLGGRFLLALEVGRVLDVGRVVVPAEELAGLGVHFAPPLVTLEHVPVVPYIEVPAHRASGGVGDLGLGRPDVAEVDGGAVFAGPERVVGQIDVQG